MTQSEVPPPDTARAELIAKLKQACAKAESVDCASAFYCIENYCDLCQAAESLASASREIADLRAELDEEKEWSAEQSADIAGWAKEADELRKELAAVKAELARLKGA